MNQQTDECLASQTQGCCEGGRRPSVPFSERSSNRARHFTDVITGKSIADTPSQCVVMPVDFREITPQFSKEQKDKIAAIADGTDALLAERAKDYGPPEINMTGIGLIWTAQLRNHWGMPDLPILSGQMVALMMAGLKLNRLAKSPGHQDSYKDLAGYAQIAETNLGRQ